MGKHFEIVIAAPPKAKRSCASEDFFFVEEEGRSVGVLMCALCSHVQERHMFSSSSRGFSLYRLLSFVQETKSQK